jgi:hypothetical protein
MGKFRLRTRINVLLFLLIPSLAFAQPASKGVVSITESDESPDVYPWRVKYPNGAITDNGDGTASVFSSSSGTVSLTANVGISSTTPGQALDVSGTVRAQGFVATNASSVNSFAGNVGINSTAPNAVLTVGGSLRVNNAGNVGIGSTVPGQNLDVQGTIRIALGGTASAPTLMIGTGNNTGLWLPATSTLAVSTGGSERLRVDSTGNVGVGSTAPGQMLDIQGTIRTIGLTTSSNVGIGTSLPNGRLTVIGGNVGVGTWNPLSLNHIWSTGATPLLIERSTGGANSNMQFKSGTASMFAGLSDGAAFGIGATGSLGTAAFTVLSNNNVGIGSITPGQKFDVQGTIRILNSGRMVITTANVGFQMKSSNGTCYPVTMTDAGALLVGSSETCQ